MNTTQSFAYYPFWWAEYTNNYHYISIIWYSLVETFETYYYIYKYIVFRDVSFYNYAYNYSHKILDCDFRYLNVSRFISQRAHTHT